MITIIHGDDIVSSRKYYFEQKGENSAFEGEKLSLSEINQILDGGGLFSDFKKIFIEDFLSKRKPSKEYSEIVNYVQKNEKEAEIFFWDGKELSKTQQKNFKNAIVKTFKFPQTMFLFLDNIKPGNGKNLIQLFHSTLENTEAELVFFMLIRQFRLLLALSDHSEPHRHAELDSAFSNSVKGIPKQVRDDVRNEPIDELKRLAPWQSGKLTKQAKLFGIEQLKKIYRRLFEIDLGQKTGGLNFTLEQAIDLFLLNL